MREREREREREEDRERDEQKEKKTNTNIFGPYLFFNSTQIVSTFRSPSGEIVLRRFLKVFKIVYRRGNVAYPFAEWKSSQTDHFIIFVIVNTKQWGLQMDDIY